MRFIRFHFLPFCAFLSRAAAANTPTTRAGELANIDAGALAFLHGRVLFFAGDWAFSG